MHRRLAFPLIALLASPLGAAGFPRNYTVTTFDRIRVEAPYTVTLATGRAPSAQAKGSPAALDAVDLRVEGSTLIIRRRSGFASNNEPVTIALSTPALRTALLVGAGSLAIDKVSGLQVDLSLQGSGVLSVASVTADKLNASAQGSGALRLAGSTKVARYATLGTASLAAEPLSADEAVVTAEGAGDVALTARGQVSVTATGAVQVRVSGNPACTVRATGSAAVTGCRESR